MIPKRNSIQLKITHHTKNEENFKLNGKKRQSTDAKTKITEILELSDRDFNAAITQMSQ